MIELNGFKNFIYRLLKRLGIIEEKHITKEQQKEMCEKAIKSNICPHDCERCAWCVDYD